MGVYLYTNRKDYEIADIPTTDTNVYVNVAQSGYTIQSVTFKFYYIYANAKWAYIHISGNNSNASRYGMVVAPYWVGDGTVWLRIRGRLNSGTETIFRTITDWFNSQWNNNIEYTINRNWSCTVNCNWTTTNYTATWTELTDIQTIMNLSNMNVYVYQTAAVLNWNKVDVSVTYS
jgi:hypothetical protein